MERCWKYAPLGSAGSEYSQALLSRPRHWGSPQQGMPGRGKLEDHRWRRVPPARARRKVQRMEGQGSCTCATVVEEEPDLRQATNNRAGGWAGGAGWGRGGR